MKFAKQIENAAHDLPESWRPHLIHYKMLKKVIPLVVGELEARGLMEQSIPFEYQLDGKKNMTKNRRVSAENEEKTKHYCSLSKATQMIHNLVLKLPQMTLRDLIYPILHAMSKIISSRYLLSRIPNFSCFSFRAWLRQLCFMLRNKNDSPILSAD